MSGTAMLQKFLKSGKGRWLILAAGILGVLLIVLSELLPESREEIPDTPVATGPVTADEYAAQLEQRLGTLMKGIAGVGNCRVMVTLENGVEYVYASEEKAGSDYSADGEKQTKTDDTESSVILIKTESGYEGLLITELQPTVKGVVVVCEGGADVAVQQRVTQAVTTVLNVTAKRVCVIAGNGE